MYEESKIMIENEFVCVLRTIIVRVMDNKCVCVSVTVGDALLQNDVENVLDDSAIFVGVCRRGHPSTAVTVAFRLPMTF